MRSLLVLLALTGAASTMAADIAALQRCRQLNEPAARLACYDAVVLPSSGPTAAPTAAGPTAAAPRAAMVPAPTAPASRDNLVAKFGMEGRATPTNELPALETAVRGRFDGWVAKQRLRLANGQVWEISDGSQAAYDLNEPKVKITRGVSGTFFMEIEGVSQTPRVRRIE